MKPVRRSQAISPFGPGAMVDFPGPVSLIHAGIDAWPFDRNNVDHREFIINDDPRLAHRLGVDFFVLPPDYRQPQRNSAQTKNVNLKLPFLRFPRWHVCPIPSCGKMYYAQYHDRQAPECRGRGDKKSHPPRRTFQVRFVAACPKGHLTDFPWLEWIFEGKPGDWIPDGVSKWLTLKSSGSASLLGMQVSAEECGTSGEIRVVKTNRLAGAFGSISADASAAADFESPLSRVGVTCDGLNPVLAIGTERRPGEGCGQHLQAILRNATNIYFSNVVSSIYIPEVKDSSLAEELLELLDDPDMKSRMKDHAMTSDSGLISARFVKRLLAEYYPELDVSADNLTDAANQHLLPRFLLDDRECMMDLEQIYKANGRSLLMQDLQAVLDKVDWPVEPSRIYPEIAAHLDNIAGKDVAPGGVMQPTSETFEEGAEEEAYRRQEYEVFTQDVQAGFPKRDLDVRSQDIGRYQDLAACNFRRIALLYKLRETRAFDGFSRIDSSGLSREERRALFAHEVDNWLPAIIVRGEGIFIEFSYEHIAEWEAKYTDGLGARLKPLQQSLAALAARRNQVVTPVTPGYLLLHTFAHLIITELVQQCGYGSAALRERIYSGAGDSPMSGVLIYTAAGDSEGTMGGLVRMGEPDRFGGVVLNAINKARWCSADPICIESRGQGPGNCNLAACHSCGLLPETSCEVQNRLLDRAMVVGTLDKPEIGYFADIG